MGTLITHLEHVEQAVLAGDEELVLLDDLVHLVEVDGLPPDMGEEFPEVTGAFRDPVSDPVDDQRQSLVLRQHVRLNNNNNFIFLLRTRHINIGKQRTKLDTLLVQYTGSRLLRVRLQ